MYTMFIYVHLYYIYVPKIVIAGVDSGAKLPLSIKFYCGIHLK